MHKPVINPPLRSIDYIMEVLAALCLLYAIVQIIVIYPQLPKTVPVHFNMLGTPDNWGPKSMVLINPSMALFFFALLTVLNRYPHIFNYPVPITENNAVIQYQLAKSLISALKFSIVGIALYMQLRTTSIANEMTAGTESPAIFIILLSFFVPIVLYFVAAFKRK